MNDEDYQRQSKAIAEWIKQDLTQMRSALSSSAVPLAPLKRLQRRLEGTIELTSESEARFFVFVLVTFLQDVFYNLTGDFPYSEEAEQKKQLIYRDIVDNLMQFAVAMEESDFNKTTVACIEMVNKYLDGVKAVNSLLTKEEH